MFAIVPTISLAFTIFTISMAVLFIFAIQFVGKPLNETPQTINRQTIFTVLGLLMFMGITGILAATGVLLNFSQIPPPFGVTMAITFGLTIFLFGFSKWGARLANGLSFQVLMGFQSFRIVVELFLFQLFKADIIPVQMTFAGLNWDILTGIVALIYLLAQTHIKIPKWALIAFNIFGLALVINIVIVAFLSAPFPIRVFMNEPANTIVGYFPFIWLPTFLVPLAIGGHILAFRKLFPKKS